MKLSLIRHDYKESNIPHNAEHVTTVRSTTNMITTTLIFMSQILILWEEKPTLEVSHLYIK